MNKLLLSLAISLLITFQVFAQTQGNWNVVGPTLFPTNNSGQINGIGRIPQIKFHPSNSQKMYAISSTGGLFISTDGANTWNTTGTDKMFRTNCASICIDYTNDQTLYMGTGDPNYYSTYYGIYKSTDGGATWNASNNGIGNRMALEILMSPTNNNVLIAATADGIWKTTDGGANWHVTKSGGDFTDMVYKPGDANTMYAASHSEFWLSTNQGDSWTKIGLPGSGLLNGGRIGVSKNNSSFVYLTFCGDNGAGTATPVFKSTNSGQSFGIVKNAGAPNLNGYDGNSNGQGNYNYSMTVDPNNANTVYIVSHVVWRSTDGGSNWSQLTNWWQTCHTDMHQIIFSPYDNTKLYNANDGGVWLSTDGGSNWVTKSDGLATSEIYHAAQSPIRKDLINIGTQDNGELNYLGTTWYTNGGGDFGGNIAFDFQDNNNVYHLGSDRSRKNLTGVGSNPSVNFPFAAGDGNGNDVRIAFNPTQTNTGFVSMNDVWRTTNLNGNPPSWTKITTCNTPIQALASSPADANIFYIVTNNGTFYRSDNALAGSPGWVGYGAPAATNSNANIAPLKSDPNIVYLTCGSRVYRSANKGANWTDVTGSLPNVNIIGCYNDIYSTDESIYIGSAVGVYYKNNTMSDWVNYSKGLPTIANINQLMLFNDGSTNSEIRVGYFGRGVWGSSLWGRGSLRTPENPALVENNLDYKYYEGAWSLLPDFSTLTPVKTGVNGQFNYNMRNGDANYAIRFTGFVEVPSDGQYTFYTASDDGSKLYIGNSLVVGNDGNHGVIEQSGAIGLKAGRHAITVEYYQGTGGQGLSVSYAGPGIAKQEIPASALYRIKAGIYSIALNSNGKVLSVKGGNMSAGAQVTTIANTGTAYEKWKVTASGDGFTYLNNVNSNISLDLTSCDATDGVFFEQWTSLFNDCQKFQIQDAGAGLFKIISKPNGKCLDGGISNADDARVYIWEFANVANQKWNFTTINTTVALTAPANNSVLKGPVNIPLTVNVAGADNTISKVEYSNQNGLIGTATTSPYTYTCTNVGDGTYVLTAKAYDNSGNTATSASSTVQVVTFPADLTDNGGTITAQYGGLSASEDISKLIDNDLAKYCFLATNGVYWVQYQSTKPAFVTSYTLVSGGDSKSYPTRNPVSWQFQGSNDGKTWTNLDAQTAQAFTDNFQKLTYTVNATKTYLYFRLNVTANGGGNVNQLTELMINGNEINVAPSDLTDNGGTITAQYGGISGAEDISKLIENDVTTKYCAVTNGKVWVKYQSPKPLLLTSYSIISGSDAASYPERNPLTWQLLGSNDGLSWDVIDTKTAQNFAGSYTTNTYTVHPVSAYYYVKLDITALNGGTLVQMAEWQLFGSEEIATSIATVHNSPIAIYPNPTSLKLIVDAKDIAVNKLVVTDIEGKVLIVKEGKEDFSQVDVSALKTGVYFINVYSPDADKPFSEKFVKE